MKYPRIPSSLFFLVFISFYPLFSQASDTKTNSPSTPSNTSQEIALPTSYRNIKLGMEIDAVKEALLQDSIFGYRGERDVSLLPGENRSLIETTGSSFIRRAWFQFYEDKLYILTIQMDTEKVDYYSMYTSLTEKYGEPSLLDPKKSQWIDSACILSLERPLTIKYVDKPVFDTLLTESSVQKAQFDILRDAFIKEF